MKHICHAVSQPTPPHLPAWSPPWQPSSGARRRAQAWWAAGLLITLVLAIQAWALAGAEGLWWVLGSAILEEAVLRALLHEALLRWHESRPRLPSGRWLPAVPEPLSLQVQARANGLVAGMFVLVHLVTQPAPWALACAVTALVIGVVYQRGRRAWPCALLHGLVNLCVLWLAA